MYKQNDIAWEEQTVTLRERYKSILHRIERKITTSAKRIELF